MNAEADSLRMRKSELTSKTLTTFKDEQEELTKQLAQVELDRKEFVNIR